jgi:exportin-1
MELRDSETIIFFAFIVEKFYLLKKEKMPKILDLMFNSTLPMITEDFSSFPNHSYNFFVFLKAIIKNAFDSNYFK